MGRVQGRSRRAQITEATNRVLQGENPNLVVEGLASAATEFGLGVKDAWRHRKNLRAQGDKAGGRRDTTGFIPHGGEDNDPEEY